MILRWWLPLFASVCLAWLMLAPLPADTPHPWPGIDKAEHLLAYAVLTLLWLARRPLRAGVAVAIVLYSLVLESAQGLTAYRAVEAADMLANALGVSLALLLTWLWRRGRAGAAA